MKSFDKSDLKYDYSWTPARELEISRINGFLVNNFLYRGEGYEVLFFIKKYMKTRMMYEIEAFHAIEAVIRNSISHELASHTAIKDWLDNNFSLEKPHLNSNCNRSSNSPTESNSRTSKSG